MLRRDMIKVAGAGAAGFFLPQKLKAEDRDTLVLTPEALANVRKIVVRNAYGDHIVISAEHILCGNWMQWSDVASIQIDVRQVNDMRQVNPIGEPPC